MDSYSRNATSSKPQKISRAVGQERETPWTDSPKTSAPPVARYGLRYKTYMDSPVKEQERGPSRDSGIDVDERVMSPTQRDYTRRKGTDRNSNIVLPDAVTPPKMVRAHSQLRKKSKWWSTPQETPTNPRDLQRSISADPERHSYPLKEKFARRATSPDAVPIQLLPNLSRAPISPVSMESLP